MKKIQLFLISSLVTGTVLAEKGKFKLSGSPQRNWEGNVMVQAEGNRALYLSLCDKGWNINTANVTCRELGFPEGARFVYYGTHFPSKKTAFDSRQWVCRGDEQDTEACGLDALRKCNGTAGVQCINPASKSEPKATCNFESDTCGYKSNLTHGDIQWQRTAGEIEDEASSKFQGHYMYLMTGRHGSGAKGQLKSPSTIFGTKCLTFSYYKRSNKGTLRAYVHTLRSYPKMVWSLHEGDQSTKWHKAEIPLDLDSKQPSHVVFEGEVGIGGIHHIAVDNIKLSADTTNCKLRPDEAKPPAQETPKSPCKQRTTEGECCVFPFTYEGVNYTSCTKHDDNHKPWCALNKNVTGLKNVTSKGSIWGECQDCTERSIHGNCCFFPFEYGGKKYNTSCVEDLDRRWCFSDKEHNVIESCGEIRLVGSLTSGHVQVYHKGRWGTVCGDSYWDIQDARVVCRELGFRNAIDAPVFSNTITKAVNREVVWLQEVDCTGNEPNLSLCLHRGWGISNCPPDKLAGVTCQANPEPRTTSKAATAPTTKMSITASVRTFDAQSGNGGETIGEKTTAATTSNWMEVRVGECNKTVFSDVFKEAIESQLESYCGKFEHKCKKAKDTGYSVTIDGEPPKVRVSTNDVSRETLDKSINDANELGGCKIIKPWNWIRMLEYGGVVLLAVLGIALYCLKRGKHSTDSSKTVYTKVPSVSEDSAEEHNGNNRKSDAEKGLLRQKEKKLNKLASKNC